MNGVHWLTLIVGILLGYYVVPLVIGLVMKKHA